MTAIIEQEIAQLRRQISMIILKEKELEEMIKNNETSNINNEDFNFNHSTNYWTIMEKILCRNIL